MIDYHIHTHHSYDGENTTLDACIYALRCNLKAIAVTDHFEANGHNFGGNSYNPKLAKTESDNAKSIYGNILQIAHGIELGQPLQNLPVAEKMLNENAFDFVLASNHNNDNNKDFYYLGSEISSADTIFTLFNQYFDELLQIARWGRFNILAHLTYPVRYFAQNGINIQISPHRESFIISDKKVNCNIFAEKIEYIYKELIKGNKGIEINTSGLFKYNGPTMPDYELVRFYKECGGELITVGSDAHRSHFIGRGIRHGLDMLKTSGFKYITVFDKQMPVMIKNYM